MTRIVTGLGLLAALLWSATIWGGFALLGATGDFLAENAGSLALPAEAREIAAWSQFFLANFGLGTAMVVWLLGLGLIAAAVLAVNLLLGLLLSPRRENRPVTVPLAPPPTLPAAAPSPLSSGNAWGRQGANR